MVIVMVIVMVMVIVFAPCDSVGSHSICLAREVLDNSQNVIVTLSF